MTQKPKPKRWLCQFRDVGESYFKTDCGFDTFRSARDYVNKVVTLLCLADGQVVDNKKKEIVYHYKKG